MLLLFTIQTVGAVTDMHLLHAHSEQHQQLHNHQSNSTKLDSKDSYHPTADNCQHSCNSHSNFTAQLPLPFLADLAAIQHQKTAHFPRELTSTHSTNLFRPPIV